jgi:oligosaccharide repeat unit polymerase
MVDKVIGPSLADSRSVRPLQGIVPARPLERIVLFCIIGATVLLVLVNGFVTGDRLPVALAFCVYVGVLAFVLQRGLRQGGWLDPIVFTVLWWELLRYTLPKIGVYLNGLEAHSAITHLAGYERDGLVIQALLLATIGIVGLCIGYRSASRIPVPVFIFGRPKKIHSKVGIVAGISLISLTILVQAAGGIDAMLLQRGLVRTDRIVAEMGSHWSVGAGLLRIACVVWLALKPDDVKRPLFVVSAVISLVLGFIATGSRGGLVSTILMMIMVWSLRKGVLPRSKIVIVGVVGIILIGMLGDFRRQTFSSTDMRDISIRVSILDSFSDGVNEYIRYGSELDGTYAVLGNVYSSKDYLLGESYLSIPFAFIPSAVLPFDKPSAGGALVSERLFGNPLNTLPPGSIGEAYWNWGGGGVVLIMLLFGMFLRFMFRLFRENGAQGWVTVLYVVTLMRAQPTSDAFYSWIHGVVFSLVMIIWFCGFPRLSRFRMVN